MASDLDISILIPTYNRAEILRETLQSMTQVDRNGILVEFVVINNNSSDHTKEVIESFTDRLPIRYLFESRPGKNCALNKALSEVPLGRLVAFTDDDVKPQNDWLKAIISVTERWSHYSVFGGKIEVIWPDDIEIPKWVNSPLIMQLGFACYDLGNSEHTYPPGSYPFGPNFWVRREVFADGDAVGGFPVILTEVLATGMPVVAFNRCDIPEIIRNGKSGFLVPEKDIGAFSEKLIYLIEHPEIWPEMGRAGRAYVEANYDINKLNDRLVEIYQQLLHS